MNQTYWRKAFYDTAIAVSKLVVNHVEYAIKKFKWSKSVPLLFTGHSICGAITQCLFESRLQKGTELYELVEEKGNSSSRMKCRARLT